MIELQNSFMGKADVSDYSFKRLVSNSAAYVYELSDKNNNLHYETFKRKESKKCVSHIAGKEVTFEAKVKYPVSNDFGLWAWCFSDYQMALACYGRLNENSQIMIKTEDYMPDNLSNANMEIVESERNDKTIILDVYNQLKFDF